MPQVSRDGGIASPATEGRGGSEVVEGGRTALDNTFLALQPSFMKMWLPSSWFVASSPLSFLNVLFPSVSRLTHFLIFFFWDLTFHSLSVFFFILYLSSLFTFFLYLLSAFFHYISLPSLFHYVNSLTYFIGYRITMPKSELSLKMYIISLDLQCLTSCLTENM